MIDMVQRALRFVHAHLLPYLIPILTISLIAIAIFAIASVFMRPDDAVVIEVVPIEDDQLQVQIAGAVARPGVYTLRADSTVADLLDMAGGPVEDAETASLDLGANLEDGQFVLVPSLDLAGETTTGPVDINTASASEFERLPGIGPVIARRIVEYRESSGGFTSVDELAEVSGISERMVQELRPLVTVETR